MGLGRYDDAYTLFVDRLATATLFRLAAHRERIAWLEGLFPNGVNEPPQLDSTSGQAGVLNELALSYKLSGQPTRSLPLYQRHNDMAEQEEIWGSVQVGLANRGINLKETGALREAAHLFRQALVLNREQGNAYQEGVSLVELGRVFTMAGKEESARLVLCRSQHIFLKQELHQWEGYVGAHRAELALFQWDITAAGTWADRAWRLADHHKVEQSFIRAALFQGRAAFGLGELERAEERLHHALTRARAVNLVDHELPTLVAISGLAFAREQYAEAKNGLDDCLGGRRARPLSPSPSRCLQSSRQHRPRGR